MKSKEYLNSKKNFKKLKKFGFQKGHKPFGRSLPGHITSEETKIKIGIANKGKKRTEENKKLFSLMYSGKNNPIYGTHRSIETKEKISKALTGRKNPLLSQTMKKLYREGKIVPWNKGMKGLVTNGTFKKGHLYYGSRNVKPTKPELKIIELIKENEFPFIYTGNGNFWIERFNPDFVCNPSKKIIELFGYYWHKNKELDKRRIETYSKYGFETLIIWDYELKNIPGVFTKIQEFTKI